MYGNITNEIIEYIYKQTKKHKNKKKLKYIIDTIRDLALDDIKPYLFTILAILILMFLMNSFNFYYYITLFMKSNPTSHIHP